MKHLLTILLVMLTASLAFAQPEAARPKNQEKTVAALRSAYWTATQTAEFYQGAARAADSEKVLGVGSLFRAAARVCQVQAGVYTRHLEGFKADKGTAPAAVTPEVKSTRENLAAAAKLAGQARETDLPAHRKSAESEGNNDAARAFRDGREGTIELVRFFKDASETMEKWAGGKRAFYVGRTCGFSVEKLDLSKCPVCGKARDDFEKVE